METTKRLHPLLTAAAVSLIVFSAVGVAALTGVLPSSRGSSEPVSVPEVQKPLAKPKARPVAQAPKTYQAPKPAPLPGVGGVIESVREVEQPHDKTIAGPVIGGIAGAVLGHQVGSGRTRTVATAVGAGAGILAGRAIEKRVRTEKTWETTVRLEDGATQSFKSEAQPAWQPGQRVRVVDGQLLKS